jgi:hypothetical protein
MIEQKQLNLHNPDVGIIGDCFRTCIACIFDVSPHAIPHGYQIAWVDKETNVSTEAKEIVNRTLEVYYKSKFVEYPIECESLDELKTYISHYYKNTYVIIGCSSKNGGHCVVMRNADYMWDPSQDNSGCVGPMEDGYYWIGLILRSTE